MCMCGCAYGCGCACACVYVFVCAERGGGGGTFMDATIASAFIRAIIFFTFLLSAGFSAKDFGSPGFRV